MSKIISEIIHKEVQLTSRDSYIFTLSCETILYYGGICANAALLKVLQDKVQATLLLYDYDVLISTIVSIRSQVSLLESNYAYDYVNLKGRYHSYQAYTRSIVSQPGNRFFGDINCYPVSDSVSCGVRNLSYLIYEILEKDEFEYASSFIRLLDDNFFS